MIIKIFAKTDIPFLLQGIGGALLESDCSSLYSVYLKTFDHLNSNCEYLVGIQQVLRLEFRMFRIWGISNVHPCYCINMYEKNLEFHQKTKG